MAPSLIAMVPALLVTGVWLKTKSLAVRDAASTPFNVIVSPALIVISASPLLSSAIGLDVAKTCNISKA